jgi:hypothetical protein
MNRMPPRCAENTGRAPLTGLLTLSKPGRVEVRVAQRPRAAGGGDRAHLLGGVLLGGGLERGGDGVGGVRDAQTDSSDRCVGIGPAQAAACGRQRRDGVDRCAGHRRRRAQLEVLARRLTV